MPPKKKSKTAAAAPKKEKSPCTKYFERLSEARDSYTDGLGSMLVRGVKRNEEDEDEDEDEDEEDEDDAAKNDSYTEEQVGNMRHIVINQPRADALEEMQELVLGEQAGEGFMMFNTSFSYQVLDSFDTFFALLKKMKKPDEKFNYLFAYTHELKNCDVWMFDHEVGWGGHKPLAKLAKAWKELLTKDNATLGIVDDDHFSRPGIMELLQQFKKQVEDIEQVDEPAIKFKFE